MTYLFLTLFQSIDDSNTGCWKSQKLIIKRELKTFFSLIGIVLKVLAAYLLLQREKVGMRGNRMSEFLERLIIKK